jgi:hypothetical protein
MHRIIAVSDTHMEVWEPSEKLKELIESCDIVTHCGDFSSYEVYRELRNYDLYAVRGNTDDDRIISELPDIEKFRVEGVKFGLVHQGNYLNSFDDLGYMAMEIGVDVLIFGHIHRFVLEKIGKIVVICPGSPTRPRLSIASCAEITVDGSKIDVQMHVVDDVVCGIDRIKGSRNVCGV